MVSSSPAFHLLLQVLPPTHPFLTFASAGFKLPSLPSSPAVPSKPPKESEEPETKLDEELEEDKHTEGKDENDSESQTPKDASKSAIPAIPFSYEVTPAFLLLLLPPY